MKFNTLWMLALLVFLIPDRVQAQQTINMTEVCEPVGISTDPDDYVNPNDPNSDLRWDWRSEMYTVYITENGQGTAGSAVEIRSPFYDQSGNLNTWPYADAVEKDYDPEDGWELLYKKFGSEAQGLQTPFFALYNKYSGTIRVFVNIVNSGTFPFTASGIKLTYSVPSGITALRQTSLLNVIGEYTFAGDEMMKDVSHFEPGHYSNAGVNDNYYWLAAEFNTLYDPCTCGLSSNMYIEAGLISEVDIELFANGTLTTIVDANPNGNNPDETDVQGFWGNVQDVATFASSIITGSQNVFTSANEGFNDGQQLVTQAQQFANNTSNIVGQENAANFARILGRLFFEAPRVNMLLNTVSTLIAFVNQAGQDFDELTNENEKGDEAIAASKVTSSDIDLKVDGQLTVSSNHLLNSLRVPGTQVVSGGGAVSYQHPIYDEVLGVWNLFEQPKFELVGFLSDSDLLIDIQEEQGPNPNDPYAQGGVYANNQGGSLVFPHISHLRLKNTPKIVLNPAARLDVVDIKYQVVFDSYDDDIETTLDGMMVPGDFEYFEDTEHFFGGQFWRHGFYSTTYQNREDFTTAIGYNVFSYQPNWDTAVIATPYLDQGCIEKYPIYSYSEIHNPRLRVKVTLKPKDNLPESDIDEILFVHTFPGRIDTTVIQEEYKVSGTVHLDPSQPGFEPVSVHLPSTFNTSQYVSGYSANNILENEVVSRSMTVVGDLYVNDNVTFAPGTYTLAATQNIYVNKSLTNLPANTYVTFEAGKEAFIMPEAVVDPEIVLTIDPSNVMDCELAQQVYPKDEDIISFCNSSVYNERSSPAPKPDVEDPNNPTNSFDDASDLDVIIYPNPANLSATVAISNMDGSEAIRLFDMAGREATVDIIRSGSSFVLNLSGLQQGLYQVQVSSNLGSVTKQLIIVQ